MTMPAATSAAVGDLASWLRARFGSRLTRVVLFGSHARGEASEHSDVDVLVVVEDLGSAETRDIDAFVGDVLTRTDILLSPLVLSGARYRDLCARERRLVAEIDRDGIPV
jgi:predicted nucleotidyltransferase